VDSPYDSNTSDGMRELVKQGFAIKRGREYKTSEVGSSGETHALVRDSDVSHVQCPLTQTVSAGVASTHGLTPATYASVTAAGRNNMNQIYHICTSVTETVHGILKKDR